MFAYEVDNTVKQMIQLLLNFYIIKIIKYQILGLKAWKVCTRLT